MPQWINDIIGGGYIIWLYLTGRLQDPKPKFGHNPD